MPVKATLGSGSVFDDLAASLAGIGASVSNVMLAVGLSEADFVICVLNSSSKSVTSLPHGSRPVIKMMSAR